VTTASKSIPHSAPKCYRLRMDLEFNSHRWRSLRKCQSALRRLCVLNGVHRLRFHPLDDPLTFQKWPICAWMIPDTSVSKIVTKVRCAATCIPNQKQARPAVVMDRLFRAVPLAQHRSHRGNPICPAQKNTNALQRERRRPTARSTLQGCETGGLALDTWLAV